MEEKEFNIMELLLLLRRKIMIVILIAIVGLAIGITFIVIANKNAPKIEGEYVYTYSTEKEYKNALIVLDALLPELLEDDELKDIELENAIKDGNIAIEFLSKEANVENETSPIAKNVKYRVDYQKLGISKELGFELVEKMNLAYKNYFVKEYDLDYKFNIKTYDDEIAYSSYDVNPHTYYDLLLDMNNSAVNLMEYIEENTIEFQNYFELIASIRNFENELKVLKSELLSNGYSKESSIYQDFHYLSELQEIKNEKEELLTIYKELDNSALTSEYINKIEGLYEEINMYEEILNAYYDVSINSVKSVNIAPQEYKDKLTAKITELKEISDNIEQTSKEGMSDKNFKQFRVSKSLTTLGKRDIVIYLFATVFVTFVVISGYLFVAYQIDKLKIKEKADNV